MVGAGPGGLTSAMLLASRGFKVTVFEKAGEVGGRNAAIRADGFTFDIGPTFLMMKFVLDDVFRAAGRKSEDYMEFVALEPMYRLYFDDGNILAWSDNASMRAEIAREFPGREKGFDRFCAYEPVRFNRLYQILSRDFSKMTDLLRPEVIGALPHLSLGKSLFDVIGSYFSAPERLKMSFIFGSKYLGMSPWECPGAYMMIPFVEHEFGLYHVMGGLNQIPAAMAKVVREHGGQIRLNTPVNRLIIDGSDVKGVELEDGEKVYADEVIVNQDFAHAMTHLVEPGRLRKYSPEKLARKRYSCSTFMLYLGLDKVYDLPHHNILFARDYRSNVNDIFHTRKLSEDMSIYIQNASVTDPSLAPAGQSALYVLVPVTNQSGKIDWEKETETYKDKVLDSIVERTSMKDLRQHIRTLKIITPDQWINDYNVYLGATFNLSHDLLQMLYFRPHNQFEELNHCYIVGGGTHPGSGLPTIYVSGQITAGMISQKYGAGDVHVSGVQQKPPVPVAR